MPCLTKSVDGKDQPAAVGENLSRGSGRQSVNYRDAKGIRRDAIVLSKGSVSGLQLFLPEQNRVVDNVGPMTTIKGTNVYDARH
jgi:hypothetical protein